MIPSAPSAAVDAGFTAADLMNLAPVFAFAFIAFPAMVILGSKLMDPSPPPAAPPARPDAGRAPSTQGAEKSAEEIFFSALDNLKKEPLGWLFGKEPTALYSNVPPPAAPAPAAELPATDATVGVVVPMGETPQDKAARERAEDAAKGRNF